MAKSIAQEITDAMAKQVVGQTTELYKAVVLDFYTRLTVNSPQVRLADGFPLLTGFTQGKTTDIANSLPDAQTLEEGHSEFKAPEGIYGVAAEPVAQPFKGATTIMPSSLTCRLVRERQGDDLSVRHVVGRGASGLADSP